MTVKLLTELHLEFLSLKGWCTGLSMSTLVKMPHCWKSQVAAQVGGTLKTNTTTTTNIFRISGGDIAALCIQVIRHKLCQYFDIVVYAQSRQMLNITNNLRMCGKLQQSYVLANIYDV